MQNPDFDRQAPKRIIHENIYHCVVQGIAALYVIPFTQFHALMFTHFTHADMVQNGATPFYINGEVFFSCFSNSRHIKYLYVCILNVVKIGKKIHSVINFSVPFHHVWETDYLNSEQNLSVCRKDPLH